MRIHQQHRAFACAFVILTALCGCQEASEDGTALSETVAPPADESPITAVVEDSPQSHYQQYCALCHGDNREGYANDSAPSLRSSTLYELGIVVPFMATAYGRPGTPMGPYLDELGGPMSDRQIGQLTAWLSSLAGVKPAGPGPDNLVPVTGDVGLGRELYAANCAECHGANGEGGTGDKPGTALGNATMLATSPDKFLRLAITEGRKGTLMQGFSDTLSGNEIDALVAFLRSRAQGWDAADLSFSQPPTLDNIVLNPEGSAPEFDLKEGRYVMATDLHQALQDGRKMVLIDTRVPYFWAMAHIRGSAPMPYYSSLEELADAIPNDDTYIVAYCECPRAAADSTVDKLRQLGYQNTAVLWEGYAGWSALGFPVAVGRL